MGDVEFEEPKEYTTITRKPSFLVRFVMSCSRGKIETEAQANIVLFVFSVIVFLVAIFVGFSNQKKPTEINTKKFGDQSRFIEKTQQ
jgi:hypothetical protein